MKAVKLITSGAISDPLPPALRPKLLLEGLAPVNLSCGWLTSRFLEKAPNTSVILR